MALNLLNVNSSTRHGALLARTSAQDQFSDETANFEALITRTPDSDGLLLNYIEEVI